MYDLTTDEFLISISTKSLSSNSSSSRTPRCRHVYLAGRNQSKAGRNPTEIIHETEVIDSVTNPARTLVIITIRISHPSLYVSCCLSLFLSVFYLYVCLHVHVCLYLYAYMYVCLSIVLLSEFLSHDPSINLVSLSSNSCISFSHCLGILHLLAFPFYL